MNKENFKRIAQETGFILLTLLVFPLSVALYLVDRVICVPLIHLETKALNNWQKDVNNVIYSLYRVIGVAVIYGLYKLIVWLI